MQWRFSSFTVSSIRMHTRYHPIFTMASVVVICIFSILLPLTLATTISKFPMTVTVPDAFAARATANRDIRYDVWSNPQRILYRLDDVYNETQKNFVRDAMAQIARDMSSCIRFEQFNPVTDSREDHIVISPNLNPGISPITCVTFPGRVIRQNAAGQKLIIFQSNNGRGCMGTKRETMSILVPVLGLRQEIKRPDRDSHLLVFPNNIVTDLQDQNLLTKYDAVSVEASGPFDFKSITNPSQTRFAKPDTMTYSPRNASQFIGDLSRLSLGDCQGLKRIYPSCNRVRCGDPYVGITGTTAASSALATEDDITKSGAGAVIAAAFAAVSKPTSTRAARTVSNTTPAPLLAFDDLDSGPIDPPMGGLEFWLDPAKTE